MLSHFFFERFDWSPNLAPISVYPFPPHICADLLSANAHLTVLVNYSEVFRTFEKEGWEITASLFDMTDEYLDSEDVCFVCSLRKGGHTAHIPPSLMARVGFEALSPEALVRMTESTKLPEEESREMYTLPGFTDEASLWL